MTAYRALVSAILSVVLVSSVWAGDKTADEKTILRIQQEIELVPSLYAKHQGAPNLKGMPKYAAKKLAEYDIDDPQTADKERKRWADDREKYGKDHPLRAAIFEAVEAMDEIQKVPPRTVLLRGQITPKLKAAFFEEQAPLGVGIFNLEKILTQMKKADGERKNEKSLRWRMNFDFARARVEGNVLFLFEYNYSLGTIRRDTLPELRPDDAGWRITFHPNMHIDEVKVKRCAEDRAKRLSKLRADHASTPWAFFADIEGDRLLGMLWSPAKE